MNNDNLILPDPSTMTEEAKKALKDAVLRAEETLDYKILIKKAKIKTDSFKVVIK